MENSKRMEAKSSEFTKSGAETAVYATMTIMMRESRTKNASEIKMKIIHFSDTSEQHYTKLQAKILSVAFEKEHNAGK